MNRKFALALAVLMLTDIFCVPGTPTPTPPGVSSGHNQAMVDGSNGTSAVGIPVNCGTAAGNVNIPAGSFSGTETISIDCIDASEQAQLDRAVENATGQTGEVLGAIKLSPSAMQFDSFVTITIPLVRQTANQYVNVYIYSESSGVIYDEVLEAQVECSGWCAKASVDHFTIFIVYETVETPATETPVSFTCTDPLGCVNYAPVESVRIAALLAYGSKNDAAHEIAALNEKGIRTALHDYGKIGGHALDLVIFDEACAPDRASANAEEIVNDAGIAGVIGTVCSSTAEAVMPYFSKDGYSMISPANTLTSLTSPNSHQAGYLRIPPPDTYEAEGMAMYAYKQLEVRYVSIVYEESELSRELAEAFSVRFMELGGKVLDKDEFSDPNAYFAKLSARIDSDEQRPDAIYMPMPSQGGVFAGIITDSQYYGDGILLLGHSSMISNNTYVDESGLGKYLTYYPKIAPDTLSGAFEYGYDATTMLLNAIARVVQVEDDGTLHIGRQALRDALYKTRDFSGKTGTLSCNQYGDCGHPLIEIYRYNSTGEFGGQFDKYFSFHP